MTFIFIQGKCGATDYNVTSNNLKKLKKNRIYIK
jgi:hypothetical protein